MRFDPFRKKIEGGGAHPVEDQEMSRDDFDLEVLEKAEEILADYAHEPDSETNAGAETDDAVYGSYGSGTESREALDHKLLVVVATIIQREVEEGNLFGEEAEVVHEETHQEDDDPVDVIVAISETQEQTEEEGGPTIMDVILNVDADDITGQHDLEEMVEEIEAKKEGELAGREIDFGEKIMGKNKHFVPAFMIYLGRDQLHAIAERMIQNPESLKHDPNLTNVMIQLELQATSFSNLAGSKGNNRMQRQYGKIAHTMRKLLTQKETEGADVESGKQSNSYKQMGEFLQALSQRI